MEASDARENVEPMSAAEVAELARRVGLVANELISLGEDIVDVIDELPVESGKRELVGALVGAFGAAAYLGGATCAMLAEKAAAGTDQHGPARTGTDGEAAAQGEG